MDSAKDLEFMLASCDAIPEKPTYLFRGGLRGVAMHLIVRAGGESTHFEWYLSQLVWGKRSLIDEMRCGQSQDGFAPIVSHQTGTGRMHPVVEHRLSLYQKSHQ